MIEILWHITGFLLFLMALAGCGIVVIGFLCWEWDDDAEETFKQDTGYEPKYWDDRYSC